MENCGIIDCQSVQVSISLKIFQDTLQVFGEESLKALISEYEKQGGEVWDKTVWTNGQHRCPFIQTSVGLDGLAFRPLETLIDISFGTSKQIFF